MKRFEITIRFDAEDYPSAIKRVAKLLRENSDITGTGIQGADHLTFEQGGENLEREIIGYEVSCNYGLSEEAKARMQAESPVPLTFVPYQDPVSYGEI